NSGLQSLTNNKSKAIKSATFQMSLLLLSLITLLSCANNTNFLITLVGLFSDQGYFANSGLQSLSNNKSNAIKSATFHMSLLLLSLITLLSCANNTNFLITLV